MEEVKNICQSTSPFSILLIGRLRDVEVNLAVITNSPETPAAIRDKLLFITDELHRAVNNVLFLMQSGRV